MVFNAKYYLAAEVALALLLRSTASYIFILGLLPFGPYLWP